MKSILNLFRKQRQPGAHDAAPGLTFETGGLQAMGDVPRYPPFTKGLPAATPAQLLDTQKTLITQLKHEVALSPEDTRELLDPLLESYAAFVHLIPASRSHHHRGAGGLLRHGLEVALWATRTFHGHIIDGHESGEVRKVLEPRWRLAVCISALCHDLGKPAYDLEITDITGRKVWDVYGGLLSEWMAAENIDRYFIRWRSSRQHKAHERFSHLLTMRVIPPRVLSYLNEGHPRIIAVMHETIAGQIPKGSARVIYDIIMEADQRSVQRDLKGQRLAEGDQALGVPVAKYLVDAMKRLIHNGQWQANQKGQPLWVGDEGVYLDWEMAVPQLVSLLEQDRLSGIPKSPDSIAESLADYDVITTHPTDSGDNSFYVSACPEQLTSTKRVPRKRMVEINGLEVLFDGPHPAPVVVHVGEVNLAARDNANAERERKQAEQRGKNKGSLREKMARAGVSVPSMNESAGDTSDGADPAASNDAPPSSEADTQPTSPVEPPKPGPQADDQVPVPDTAPARESAPNRATEHGTPEPSDNEAHVHAQQWLAKIGEAGQILRVCAMPGFPGSQAYWHEGEIVVPYPSGMDQFEDQRASSLAQIKAFLKPHPTVPDKPTHKISVAGKKAPVTVLILGREATRHISALASPGTSPQPPAKAAPDHETGATTPPAQPEQASGKANSKVEPKSKPKTKPKAKASTAPKTSTKAGAKPQKSGETTKQPARETPPKSSGKDRDQAVARAQGFFNAILEQQTPFNKRQDEQGRGVWVPYKPSIEWYITNVAVGMRQMELVPALYKAGVFAAEIPQGESEQHLLILNHPLE